MKTKSIVHALLCVVFLASSLVAQAGQEYPEEEREFCWGEIDPAVEIYLEQGMAAGLERIEEGYLRYEEKYPHPELAKSCCTPYYQSVWWEAQVKSGREDEEWGLELFTYLLERSRSKNPQLEKKISGNHYALFGNIMERCRNTGKIAEMQAWARQLEADLKSNRGMDLECASYPDRGAIFSFLPQARKYAFPMKHRDFPRKTYSCQCNRYVYYTYIYGLRDVATAYLGKGDWVRSAELYQWFLDYADETLLEENRKNLTFPAEMVHEAAMVTQSMANICALHGHPEEGLRFYADYIEKAEGYYHSEPVHIYNAKLRAELLRIELGELSADAIEVADKACELMADNKFYSRWDLFDLRVARARVYHAAGRRDEAWIMMEELLALGEADITPRHRVRMLGGAIALALADGGTRPELEGWLMEALENERRLGNKFGELSLYVQYARFLALNGCHAEAEAIQSEAVRLAKATNLPDRFAAETQRLADMQNRRTETGHREITGGSSTSQSGWIGIDLQPRRSSTAALEGGIAYGRFFLSNPSFEERSGTLSVSGPVARENTSQTGWSLKVSPEFGKTRIEQPVTLPPGGSYMVDLAGTSLPDGSGAQVRFGWQPAGETQPAVSSVWEYEATLDGHRTAVIDAHAIKANPFYLVPILHTLQRAMAGEQTIVDLVVCASAPVRIELYDAATSELIYVDANGDGDFEDRGDLIASDVNGNHWPDLAMLPAETLRSFIMYIEQSQPGSSPLELHIKVLEDGIWTTDSIDLVE